MKKNSNLLRDSLCAVILTSISSVAFSASQTLTPPPLPSNQSLKAGDLASQVANTGSGLMQQKLHDSKMPDWLRRTDVNFGFGSDLKPAYEINTIQPLFSGVSNTWFAQGHIIHRNNDETYNLGTGWRYLTKSKTWMPGLNAFFDMSRQEKHHRLGLGGELFGKYITLRANYYCALTDKKLVNIDRVAFINTYQQVLGGYDYSIEAPVPLLPWISFTAEGYTWKGKELNNIRGAAFFFRASPLANLQVELGLDSSSGNVTSNKYFTNLTWYFGAPDYIEYAATDGLTSHTEFTARNVEAHRLEQVRRHDEVVVETTTTSTAPATQVTSFGNGAVFIGRGA